MTHMTNDPSFTIHPLDQMLWIRLNSRGCFLNSAKLKAVVENYQKQGGNYCVIDLELCPGVDSTFMGTLIGLSNLCDSAGGKLQLISPTERTRSAMESLGLDMIIDIDPTDEEWFSQIDQIRKSIEEKDETENLIEDKNYNEIEQAHHVLKAHRDLSALNEENKQHFEYVCESLEEEIRLSEGKQE